MSYLFLSFAYRLGNPSNKKNELYNQSLNEQFEQIKKRIPYKNQVKTFKDLIEKCFPSGMTKHYYISCPNFLREKETSKSGNIEYLDNVVVRPELTLEMKKVLPNNQNIILIGKIVQGRKLKNLEVKGLQFIDENIASSNDVKIKACACNSFKYERKTNRNGDSFNVDVWSISDVEYDDTIFTENFVSKLISKSWTVSEPEEVIKSKNDWTKYIGFRKYYLKEQSNRNFKLNKVMFIESYAINKKEFIKNKLAYENFILDEKTEFKHGDMIILSRKIGVAEEFPLIRVDIERNKKNFNEKKVQKRGKLISEEERKIRLLSKDKVFITSIDPQNNVQDNDTNDEQKKTLIEKGYVLGDRFKMLQYDVEPTELLEELYSNYNKNIITSENKIDQKYEEIINREINNEVSLYKKELENENQEEIYSYKKELEKTIEKDILENKDQKIINLINEKKREIQKRIKKTHRQEKKENNNKYSLRIDTLIKKEIANINIKTFYLERNAELLNKKAEELANNSKQKIQKYHEDKNNEINNKYKEDIRNEKNISKNNLYNKLQEDENKVRENETIIRFSIYFRLANNNSINEKDKKNIEKCEYIVYDKRAEETKILRQEAALNNFYSGYVKNPYLSTYLFNPEELENINLSSASEWEWHLESLNEKQREAVRKAVSSNGIFLLQGPPGTGKTQVIAEAVAQLVKKGKKVLISSETHKAIDNVFERLPKIADIVPIRLIPSNNDIKKENDYDPKFLVDNFYLNISHNMHKAVDRYNNFEDTKNNFDENFNNLKLDKAKIEKYKKQLDKANQEIQRISEKEKDIDKEITSLREELDALFTNINCLKATKRYISKNQLTDDEVRKDFAVETINKLNVLLKKTDVFSTIDINDLINKIEEIKNDEVQNELIEINLNTEKIILENEKNKFKTKLDSIRDEIGELKDPKDKELETELKRKIKDIINKQNKNNENQIYEKLKLCKIFNLSYLNNNKATLAKEIETLKEEIIKIKAEVFKKIDIELNEHETKKLNIEEQINSLNQQRERYEQDIFDIKEKDDIKKINKIKSNLDKKLIDFFKDFEIIEPYKNIDDALAIIEKTWTELKSNAKEKEQENKEKIPMYEKIANYITKENVIENDRKEFTKSLFENANVFGITCTSRDKFRAENIDSLSTYNIEALDIKSVGIDVVIIDEVSKSSFVDLLIPILYGKTVILVGDHRQLPPMYEFSKLRDNDFEGLDDKVINPEINKEYTKLYEECFFKTLFEKIPNSYKTMLVQQYRCHEHIMNVFNHFYKGKLQLGFQGQNNDKKHNVTLFSNGRRIIEEDKHIYFVDCKENETHEADSTSMYNNGEAKVVVELIKKLNNYFMQHSNLKKLSIGVICTYGDQARRIKELIKSEKVKFDGFEISKEKMIVSTVDDFQGDERDIIIFSTVRNPIDPAKSNPGFILAYQRINVALSRARRMLIMVGNRKYIEQKGVIDLPDVDGIPGKEQKNFRVYEEILSTIETYGKVIDDIDVLDNKGDDNR